MNCHLSEIWVSREGFGLRSAAAWLAQRAVPNRVIRFGHVPPTAHHFDGAIWTGSNQNHPKRWREIKPVIQNDGSHHPVFGSSLGWRHHPFWMCLPNFQNPNLDPAKDPKSNFWRSRRISFTGNLSYTKSEFDPSSLISGPPRGPKWFFENLAKASKTDHGAILSWIQKTDAVIHRIGWSWPQ